MQENLQSVLVLTFRLQGAIHMTRILTTSRPSVLGRTSNSITGWTSQTAVGFRGVAPVWRTALVVRIVKAFFTGRLTEKLAALQELANAARCRVVVRFEKDAFSSSVRHSSARETKGQEARKPKTKKMPLAVPPLLAQSWRNKRPSRRMMRQA
jgi:hypothetical protein